MSFRPTTCRYEYQRHFIHYTAFIKKKKNTTVLSIVKNQAMGENLSLNFCSCVKSALEAFCHRSLEDV